MKVKAVFLTIAGLILVLALLAGTKTLQIRTLISKGKAAVLPPEAVTTIQVKEDIWESLITAVGSLEAVQGVTITAEVTGKVTAIAFEPGSRIKAGELLLHQDVSAETAQLRSAEAAADLARVTFERSKKMLASKVVPEANLDNAEAQLKQAQAQIDIIRAAIGKKTIRAPFAGRLGIRQVHLGQIIKEGEAIVSLQSMDPIFVNFRLPQQQLPNIQIGYPVRIHSDGLPPGRILQGTISAINPNVDAESRNIQVQATIDNQDELVRPGMFVNVTVVQPERKPVLVIPITAVLYAPYSDSVFLVENAKDGDKETGNLVAHQAFVRLGEKRGDFVSVTSGLTPNQTVVSTGAFKLRNGQSIAVNNALAPEFKLIPQPKDS